MADKKISELVSITGSATAADDYFVVVDTSGAVTHKISREELNNAIEQDVLSSIEITDITNDVNVQGTVTADGLTMDTSANSTYAIELGADRTSAGQALGIIRGSWNNTVVAQINLAAGDDTTNKDNGRIFLRTASAGSTANRLQVAENGDISFYDSTGTTSAFFWDASAESLGIGTSSPSQKLDVAAGGKLYLRRADNATGTEIYNGGSAVGTVIDDLNNEPISFKQGGSEKMRISGGNLLIGQTDSNARLASTSTTNKQLSLRYTGVASYYTSVDSSGNYIIDKDGSEHLRIDNGNLLVGKTAPNIGVAGAEIKPNGNLTSTANGDWAALFNRLTSDGEIVNFRKDGTTVGSIGTIGSDLCLTSNNVGFRMDGSNNHIIPVNDSLATRDAAIDLGYGSGRFKDLYLSGGVFLGGAGSANYLDDYEEGTFTPGASRLNASAHTYAFQHGHYTKIGRVVHVKISIQITGTTTIGSGINHIFGLPFTNAVSGAAGYGNTAPVHYNTALPGTADYKTAMMYYADARIHFELDATAQDTGELNGDWENGYIALTMTYFTDQ